MNIRLCLLVICICLLQACRAKGPSNKAIESKKKPSKELVAGYKDGIKKLEKGEKRRLKKEARQRYKRQKAFENNKVR